MMYDDPIAQRDTQTGPPLANSVGGRGTGKIRYYFQLLLDEKPRAPSAHNPDALVLNILEQSYGPKVHDQCLVKNINYKNFR